VRWNFGYGLSVFTQRLWHPSNFGLPQRGACRHSLGVSFPDNTPPAMTAQTTCLGVRIMIRLVVSAGIWIVVSALSLRVAWENGAEAPLARYEQFQTQMELRDLAKAMTIYREQFGNDAKSLNDLQVALTNNAGFSYPKPLIVDGWRQPFIYTNSGTNSVIISYGRDGKPGGEGLDFDLTTKDWTPKGAKPTLHQFLFDMPTRGMINTCLVSGGMAALLAALTIKVPDLGRQGLKPLAEAIMVAVILSALHVPSGH